MLGRLFDSPLQLVILVLVIVVVVGWKRLPDIARSLGRSVRILKSEVDEMKQDGKTSPSAASSDTVKGDTVKDDTVKDDTVKDETADETVDPTSKQAADPVESQPHNQPPA